MRPKKKDVQPVQLVAAILFRDPGRLEAALGLLAESWSTVDYRAAAMPFKSTNYYQPEMGEGLLRTLISFRDLIAPESLSGLKLQAAKVEGTLSREGRRTVNIDPGYLDLFKLVLASFKERGNKLYLGQGVWADPTLYFEKGRFHPFHWSFPDFAAGCFAEDLLAIRERYKARLRKNSSE